MRDGPPIHPEKRDDLGHARGLAPDIGAEGGPVTRMCSSVAQRALALGGRGERSRSCTMCRRL